MEHVVLYHFVEGRGFLVGAEVDVKFTGPVPGFMGNHFELFQLKLRGIEFHELVSLKLSYSFIVILDIEHVIFNIKLSVFLLDRFFNSLNPTLIVKFKLVFERVKGLCQVHASSLNLLLDNFLFVASLTVALDSISNRFNILLNLVIES